jgi:hypothetical protein
MRATQDCTRPSTSTSSVPGTVFTPAFLERIRRLKNPPTARQAALAGPWEVEPVWSEAHGRQYGVSRRDEPLAKGGRVFGVFSSKETALQTAAVLPAVGAPLTLHLNANGHRLGFALHDGQGFLGHLSRDEPRLLPHLHLARSLAADPDALAALMEAVGPEALAMLGRVLHRRLERVAG